MHDPRVLAVIAVAPDGDIWGAEYEGVTGMQVPTLIIAGSDDDLVIPEWSAYPIYQHLGSKQKGLVVFTHESHFLMWNTHADAYRHIQVAFLLALLKGDPAAAKVLLPENMTAIPDVTYETTGFSVAK